MRRQDKGPRRTPPFTDAERKAWADHRARGRVGNWAVVFAALLLVAGVSVAQNIISGGSGNPSTGNAALTYLAVNHVDAGTVWLGPGSAAAPPLSFAGDPNTGPYWIGADQLGVATGGVRSFDFTATPGVMQGIDNNSFLTLNNVSGSGLTYGASSIFCTGSLCTATASTGLNVSSNLQLASVTLLASSTPTVSSGFGTSPSIVSGKAYAFRVNVGTGGTANSGVLALGTTATTGWRCNCDDITTQSATVFQCKQTATSTTTATIGNFNTSGAAAAWVASDNLLVDCTAY